MGPSCNTIRLKLTESYTRPIMVKTSEQAVMQENGPYLEKFERFEKGAKNPPWLFPLREAGQACLAERKEPGRILRSQGRPGPLRGAGLPHPKTRRLALYQRGASLRVLGWGSPAPRS